MQAAGAQHDYIIMVHYILCVYVVCATVAAKQCGTAVARVFATGYKASPCLYRVPCGKHNSVSAMSDEWFGHHYRL